MLDKLNRIGYDEVIQDTQGDKIMNDETTLTRDQAFTIEALRHKLEADAARMQAQRRLNGLLFPNELTLALD